MSSPSDRAARVTSDPKFHSAIVRAISRAEARCASYWWACATGETGHADTSAQAMRDADTTADAWVPRVLRASGPTVEP